MSHLLEDLSAWHRELTRVTPDRVYLPLPATSYHVTIAGLWFRKAYPSAQAYNQHNDAQKAKLAALDADLAALPPLRLNSDIHEAAAQYSIALAPADQNATALLHRAQNVIKGAYPALRLSHPHMSLGYKRTNNAQLTLAETEHIAAVMRTLPPVLTYGAPRVCAYRDMTAFIPIFELKK